MHQNKISSAPGPKHIATIVIGNFKVTHRPGQAFERAKARFIQQGFQVHETPHFLVACPAEGSTVFLVHRLAFHEIDNNLGDLLMCEIEPLGYIPSAEAFGAALIGIVISVMPDDPVEAWNLFSSNTLQRLREKLDGISSLSGKDTITASACIYQRLLSLRAGSSLLDAGCASAFWPVLVAEREQLTHGRIVGVDNRLTAIRLSTNLANLVKQNDLEFLQMDITASDFSLLGTFDTVTAIHLLEHLPENQLAQAFEHLLQVTAHRLIIAVPYEEHPTIAYGHEQVFTRDKLETWGQWCVERLHGQGYYWCEEVRGGILVIDKKRS